MAESRLHGDLRILATARFRRFKANYASCTGIEFQVTKCEKDRCLFYVRENFRYESFASNSGVRWGLQQGHHVRGTNVLELACASDQFENLARAVHEADALKRPVVRNRAFTLRTAPRFFQGL